jgi:predicted phosphohydrolase
MIIQYCSDLHLEFSRNRDFINENPITPGGDILLLAGDIVPFKSMHKHMDFFNYLSDHFQVTYWIPGNHEYYGSDIAERSGSFEEKICSNVHLLNNKAIMLNNVKFIFSTLWSNISPGMQWAIERGLSDFLSIKNKGVYFTTNDYNALHLENLEFIKNEMKERNSDHCVVITHHVPTRFNYPEEYKNSAINEAFVTELFPLIDDFGPDVWIYGHHHRNSSDFKIGNTIVTTNQLGYVHYNEHAKFNSSKHLSIE